MKNTIINLTPHKIVVYNENNEMVLEIEPSGDIARISSDKKEVRNVNNSPYFTISYGSPSGLPETQEGVLLLVSGQVRMACPKRKDLISPGELIRNKQGQPIGCLGFVINGGVKYE